MGQTEAFPSSDVGCAYPVSSPPNRAVKSSAAAFADGLKAASRSVFLIVLIGSYTSIGALAHNLGFSVGWTVLSTVIVWAAPAQVILITSLGAGGTPVATALAVGLSALRLLPMVMALMPVLQTRRSRFRDLFLPAHFTAVSMWIESLRLAPAVPRENRIAFANGLAIGLMAAPIVGTIAGSYLAEVLPVPLVAAMLFLTPMSFFTSALRNAHLLSDRIAYGIGLVLAASCLRAGRVRSVMDGSRRRQRGLRHSLAAEAEAMSVFGDLAPYIVLVLAGFLPNEIWRMLGIFASRRLDETSEWIVWVRAVATAILTGVVAKIVIFAPGALADVSLKVRLGAVAAGLAAYFLLRGSVFAGVIVGTLSILAGIWAFP